MNHRSTPSAAFLATVLAFLSTGRFTNGSPPLWGRLEPGAFAVGFKTTWRLDYSRRYSMTYTDKTTYASGKAPRPILVNIWYPAKTNGAEKPMLHRNYFDVQSHEPLLEKFSKELVAFNLAVLAKELLEKPANELTAKEKSLLDQFLATPTACFRNAIEADGRFPLVVYHSGHGSSFEDNAVLCEFLASHGFVVIGSAFQEPRGESFNTDGGMTSVGDFQLLIAYSKSLPNVDWNHIGVAGHSGGAHATLTYRAQQDCLADAVVSLDTTQDYYCAADKRWEPMSSTVLKNRKNMKGAILMVANPHAFFDLADSCSSARRYYFTVKDLGHNDFAAQGVRHLAMQHQLHATEPLESRSKPEKGEPSEKEKLEAATLAYESLCNYMLQFFNAELKEDAVAKKYLEKQFRDTKLEGSEAHVVYVPEGVSGPEPCLKDSPKPPTPRQLRYFYREHGATATVALMRRSRKESPKSPIYHQIFGLALVGELLDQGKTKDAIAFNEFYRECDADCAKLLTGWAKVYVQFGRKALARDYLKKVLLLQPNDAEAAAKLKELGEPTPGEEGH